VNDGPTEDAHPEHGGVSASTALEIVDADGLAGLSMRKLAVQSHVKTKNDLLHEIGNQIMERRRRSRSAIRRLL
jgi:hypothetical protein